MPDLGWGCESERMIRSHGVAGCAVYLRFVGAILCCIDYEVDLTWK